MEPITQVIEQDDKIIFNRVQDVEPILESAQRRRLEGVHGSSEMRHAASFPLVIVEQYCNTAGITFDEFCSNQVHAKRMLQDPALSYFRIWEGNV